MNVHEFLNRFGSLQIYSFIAASLVWIWFPNDKEVAVKIMASNLILFLSCVFLYFGIDQEE
jgi:hypothetical protein